MPDLLEQLYCAEQIKIPPSFPHILKQYAKAAIRTQPYDLLKWTAAYFQALASGVAPPVKERLEYPPFAHPSGITPGYLKVMLKRFGCVTPVDLYSILEYWRGMVLPEDTLYRILLVGGYADAEVCDLYRFLAIACGLLGNNLLETMVYVCELFTDEPEGGSSMIPLQLFLGLYRFLAETDCSGEPPPTTTTTTPPEVQVSREPPLCQVSRVLDDETRMREDEQSSLEGVPGTSSEDIFTEARSYEGQGNLQDIKSGDDQSIRGSRVSGDEVSVDAEPQVADRVADWNDGDMLGIERNFPADDDYQSLSAVTMEFPGEVDGEAFDEGSLLTYEPIGLDTFLDGICECLEPIAECSPPTPPPPDPLEEFLGKMAEEVRQGRFDVLCKIPGIGPPVPTRTITEVGIWLREFSKRQGGLVGPRNITHFLCPDLE